jgi:DNA-binding NarL/FixJ family response regulator
VLREAISPVRSGAAQARLSALLAPAHERLGPDRTAELIAAGRLLGTHDGARYALATGSGAAADPADRAEASRAEASRPEASRAEASRADPDRGANGTVLTAREHEIARLIGRGLSNRGIAEELFISPATAARHVANILAKLGLNSRTQVATWVVGQQSR